MAKQLDEDSLKRQARRRLIGAIVLVTVVVAVLPMLLDSEPKSPAKDIELRIPDKDKAGEFVPHAALPAVPAVTPPASSPVAASAPAVATSVAASAPVAAPQPAVAATPPTAASQVMPSSAQASGKPVPATEQKPASAKPEAVPAEAAHKEQAPAAQAAEFIVQIGAFSNFDTAHRWHKNLLNQGIKAYTEKAGDKLRVRAGPYPTREAAEKVRHRLESQGLHPNIIAQD